MRGKPGKPVHVRARRGAGVCADWCISPGEGPWLSETVKVADSGFVSCLELQGYGILTLKRKKCIGQEYRRWFGVMLG